MIVRKIREEEYLRTREVFAIAFEQKLDPSGVTPQALAQVKEHPQYRSEVYWQDCWAAFTEEGKMMSFLRGAPATVRFDGQEALCTCIGAVSSLPQYRGRGAIAGCFRKHLEDSFAAGVEFSYLYPFSTKFYRQFGYELCVQTVEWTVDLGVLPVLLEKHGEAILNEGVSQYEAMQKVYDKFAQGYNLSFVREDCDWLSRIGQNPAQQGRYTYVWYNAAKEAKGVLSFEKERDASGENTMVCDMFYYADAEGLKGLLQHIRSYRSHYKKVRFTLPVDVALERLLPEVEGCCRRELRFLGMGRVIHVENALRKARYQGSGQVCFRLNDPYLPENNGVFQVAFQDGACVDLQREGNPEVELDMAQFSRLLLGGSNIGEWAGTPFEKVFYPKKMFLGDFF